MNFQQSVRYLLTLGRELASPQQARAAKFDLKNIRVLTEHWGHPERTYPSVHIAGTNGKGSTAAMLASILGAAGLRVGLYTSPHLVRINERLRIAGAEITDSDFAAVFTRLHHTIEELLASGALAAHPTYFECVTAMAFLYFAEQKADIAVFEAGMGGRLDATNVLVPEVAVITQIDFDHESFLGHSIDQIAAEKAGIIKPGAWVVSAAGNPAASRVIRERALQQNARLVDVQSAWNVFDTRVEDGRCEFSAVPQTLAGPSAVANTVSARESPQDDEPGKNAALRIRVPLAGRYQIRNALTAVSACRLLAEKGFPVDDRAIVRGLATVRWPGRIERLRERPSVYLDGTHNPAGARELAAFWHEQFSGRRIHLVYSAMRDKAVDEVAGLLFPLAATVIVTQSPQPRAISAHTLASMTGYLAAKIEVVPDPGAALERALQLATPEDVIFVAGSLYLVGDISQYWHTMNSKTSHPIEAV